jgi:hypothetical protein
MQSVKSNGCKKVANWYDCNSKPLPNGTVKDKVAFLLNQPYKRSAKDITKIIYPELPKILKSLKVLI